MNLHAALCASLLLLGSGEALAFALEMRLNPASADPSLLLEAGDSVILDVYLDAESGLGGLATAVLFDDDGILEYRRSDSTMPPTSSTRVANPRPI